MSRVLVFGYGLIAYVMFFGVLLYAIAFVGDFAFLSFIPQGIDTPAGDTPFWTAVGIDVALLGVFAVQHSAMARQGFKDWWTNIIPEAAERSTYVLVTNILFIVLFWQWRPIELQIWSVESAAGIYAIWGLYAVGWGLVLVSSFLIDHFELFGMRQVYAHFKGEEFQPPEFQTPGLYKIVRHPLLLGFLIAFWATPHMTAGHLLFAVLTTGYTLVGIFFEERDLVDQFGDQYREYRSQTGMLFPWPSGGGED